VVDGANASADSQRHEALVRRALDDVHDGRPAMGAGRDVEKDHLIGPLFVVTDGQFHGVADVAKPAGLGASELHAAGHLPGVDIKTRNDATGEHGGSWPEPEEAPARSRDSFALHKPYTNGGLG